MLSSYKYHAWPLSLLILVFFKNRGHFIQNREHFERFPLFIPNTHEIDVEIHTVAVAATVATVPTLTSALEWAISVMTICVLVAVVRCATWTFINICGRIAFRYLFYLYGLEFPDSGYKIWHQTFDAKSRDDNDIPHLSTTTKEAKSIRFQKRIRFSGVALDKIESYKTSVFFTWTFPYTHLAFLWLKTLDIWTYHRTFSHLL